MKTTLEQFIAGYPLAYHSFSGAPCVATWRQNPAPHLDIRNASGRRVAAPLMPRHMAESFYAGIAAEHAAAGQMATQPQW